LPRGIAVERPTDKELIEELKKRFEENEMALNDLQVMTKKLEKLNKRLQESEAMKSNFLSNIRNEINNPLASIMGLSKQILSIDDIPEQVVSVANMIYAESFALDFQLMNIFLAAEIEAGESVLSISKVEIKTLLKHAIYSLAHRIEEKNVKVEVISDIKGKCIFNTDPEKLRAVLMNLLANAIEFSYDGQQVNINADMKDRQLNISVEDFGKGISKEDQNEIFDRFKQLEMGTRKSHRGHGLGLSITKALVELLDGNISFSSEPGKGCVFSTSIPEAAVEPGMEAYSEEGNEFIFEEDQEEGQQQP
jgi:signal transduction histidine kinase